MPPPMITMCRAIPYGRRACISAAQVFNDQSGRVSGEVYQFDEGSDNVVIAIVDV